MGSGELNQMPYLASLRGEGHRHQGEGKGGGTKQSLWSTR